MLSSSDIANATANDARRSLQDQQVLIDWLIARIDALETFLVVDTIERPELPSEEDRRKQGERLERFREYGFPQQAPGSLASLLSKTGPRDM